MQEEKTLMEATGCNAMQVRYEMPVEMRAQYLSHEAVMAKALPEIAKMAKDKSDDDSDDDDE